MKYRPSRLTFALAGALTLTLGMATSPVSASVVSFDSPTGLLGGTQTYGGVVSLSAFIDTTSTAGRLFGKSAGFGEQGVGVCTAAGSCDGDHEISTTPDGFIQVKGINGTVLTSITIGSVTGDDAFSLYGSNSATFDEDHPTGTAIALDVHGSGVVTEPVGPFAYYYVFSNDGNELLASATYTSVPEPATVGLFGLGLFGLGLIRRRHAHRHAADGALA